MAHDTITITTITAKRDENDEDDDDGHGSGNRSNLYKRLRSIKLYRKHSSLLWNRYPDRSSDNSI